MLSRSSQILSAEAATIATTAAPHRQRRRRRRRPAFIAAAGAEAAPARRRRKQFATQALARLRPDEKRERNRSPPQRNNRTSGSLARTPAQLTPAVVSIRAQTNTTCLFKTCDANRKQQTPSDNTEGKISCRPCQDSSLHCLGVATLARSTLSSRMLRVKTNAITIGPQGPGCFQK